MNTQYKHTYTCKIYEKYYRFYHLYVNIRFNTCAQNIRTLEYTFILIKASINMLNAL